jgi:hypothetical protein
VKQSFHGIVGATPAVKIIALKCPGIHEIELLPVPLYEHLFGKLPSENADLYACPNKSLLIQHVPEFISC